jgi:hypothetical protein
MIIVREEPWKIQVERQWRLGSSPWTQRKQRYMMANFKMEMSTRCPWHVFWDKHIQSAVKAADHLISRKNKTSVKRLFHVSGLREGPEVVG